MKRVFAALALVTAWMVPGVASAHPLGNFTVNHYARLEPAGDRVRVVYVLDMSELPTFQERARYAPDPAAYAKERAEQIGDNLHLELNGRAAPLRLEQRAISFPEGTGGLPTLRLEATYSASVPPAGSGAAPIELSFRDDNDPTRIGWREIVARAGVPDMQIQHSSVPATDVTDELRSYPADLLNSPLDVREARLGFSVGSASDPSAGGPAAVVGATRAVAPSLPGSGIGAFDRARSALADLANGAELTPAFIVFALGVAIVLGAAHALQPGHGKTIVAAYLVGARGTPKHALFLGATVTATHTAGVYALGLVTLFLSRYILPERLYPILEVVSGGLVIAIGAWLLARRLLTATGLRRADHHHHGHAHEDHDHTHPHGADHVHGHSDDQDHDHAAGARQGGGEADLSEQRSWTFGRPRARRTGEQRSTTLAAHRHHGHAHAHGPRPGEHVSWKSLLALGVSGGLLPCPEALMVLLITIAAHRVLFGLLLIVAFSSGLAAVLVGFGLLLVYARGLFARVNLAGGLAPRLLPVASALVIVVAGGVITAQALPQVL
jgi:ABC-type nickel/cobalt efflux system permease component RcnA